MPTCPRCQSVDCQPNKLENVTIRQIAGGTLVAEPSRRISDTISALLLWAGVEASNYFRDPWRCRYCQWTF